MYDYSNQISDFLTENFEPAVNAEVANTRFTSEQLLSFLFNTFPEGCITDYELNELMLKLKYKRETYTIDTEVAPTEKENEENAPIQFSYTLCTGWCMVSIALKQKID